LPKMIGLNTTPSALPPDLVLLLSSHSPWLYHRICCICEGSREAEDALVLSGEEILSYFA
jgi:hypothetical protein